MTQEEKARAYDEALKRAKAAIDIAADKDLVGGVVRTILPELTESEDEDERIRKALIDGVRQIRCKNGITQEQMIDYLEKQKDLDKMIVVSPEVWDNAISDAFENGKKEGEKQKENPKSADSIPSDCTSDAKYEDRWHKVGDSLPDNGREVLAKDKLGNTLLARYDGEGWDVSVYDNDDYRCHNGISKWCEIPSEKQKEQKHDATDAKSERVIKAARSVLNNWLDGTDCPDVSGDFAELEYAIREYDGEERQKERVPENEETGTRKEQKPAEYLSKEKVFAIMKKLTSLSFCVPLGSDEEKRIDEITRDVRSLLDYPIEQKPTEWKPQPESLEALMYAIEGEWDKIKPTSYLSRRLEDLYEGLVNTYNVDEPLIAELPKTAYTAKDIEELKVLKDKIEASMESPVDKPAKCEDCAMYLSGNCIHPNGKCENVKSKQEWSKEDEKIRKTIVDILERSSQVVTYEQRGGSLAGSISCSDKYEKEIAWLKSLRPSWKPSEEQLRILSWAANGMVDKSIAAPEMRAVLRELYEDLKKL